MKSFVGLISAGLAAAFFYAPEHALLAALLLIVLGAIAYQRYDMHREYTESKRRRAA